MLATCNLAFKRARGHGAEEEQGRNEGRLEKTTTRMRRAGGSKAADKFTGPCAVRRAMAYPRSIMESVCEKSLRRAHGKLPEHFRVYGAKLAIRHATLHN